MHPTATTRSAPTVLAATLMVAVISALLLGLVPSAPAAAQTNSEYDLCLQVTNLTKFDVSARSTFNRASTLSWQANLGCGGMTVKVNGQTVSATGTQSVQPAVTTTYTITAHIKSLSKVLGSHTVVAGKSVRYAMTRGGWQQVTNSGPVAEVVNEQARRTFDALPQANRAALIGKVVEVHIIPTTRKLTQLPDWQAYANDTTFDGRNYSDLRGVGASLREGYRLPLAVAEEEMVVKSTGSSKPLGYILQHELGHTVLDFATTSWQKATNASNLAARTAAGGPWLGVDWYTSSNSGEYFAEGTAALFRYPTAFGQTWTNQYTPQWLMANDPAHYQLLNQVYALR